MNKILKIILLTVTMNSVAQDRKLIDWPDYVIGDYGFELKTNKIGEHSYYDCSEGEICAECYGYFEVPNATIANTTLYVIGKKLLLNIDNQFDVKTFKVLKHSTSKTKKGLYFDKNALYKGLYLDPNSKGISLKGFKHLTKVFFTKNDLLYIADDYGFYKITNSKNLDFQSIKHIAGNFFSDKNGYYYANTYDISYGKDDEKEIQYQKIQEVNLNPEIVVKPAYCVINKQVYALNSHLLKLDLDYKKIKQFMIDDYNGKFVLYDGNTTYYAYGHSYSLEKINCNNTDEKNKLYCLANDFSKIKLLRNTMYSIYHYDEKNGILYFMPEDDNTYSGLSGALYKTADTYFLSEKNDIYGKKIKEVKIWNSRIKDYESLDSKNYKYIYNDYYYYKGNLYEKDSRLVQKDFDAKTSRVLKAYSYTLIADKNGIVAFDENNKINIKKLKVLKMQDGEPTNYLTDGTLLLYKNQIIYKHFNEAESKVVNQDLIITPALIFNKELLIKRSEFKITIKFL